MNCPYCTDDREIDPPRRGPLSLWAPLAIIALVLVAASVASALTPDTRDFKQRHQFVPTHGRAL